MRTIIAAVAIAAVLVAPLLIEPTPVSADGCFTWTRTLRLTSPPLQGEDVRQLQIRLAGWGGFRNHVDITGVFGLETAAAVARFQAAYQLPVTGIAGPPTFGTIYGLQDADCTPIHFDYAQFAQGGACGAQDFGANLAEHGVSAADVRANLLRVMWKLEALRRQLDWRDGVINDAPLTVTSGFRSHPCQLLVSDAHPSQHEYGTAADLVSDAYSLCTIARQARFAGFGTILGPGIRTMTTTSTWTWLMRIRRMTAMRRWPTSRPTASSCRCERRVTDGMSASGVARRLVAHAPPGCAHERLNRLPFVDIG